MRFRSAHLQLSNAGMTLIEGLNKDDESASSNGAGKSTLVDALLWGLYGVTSHESPAEGDDVVNEKRGANCKVTITLEIGDVLYTISRMRAWKKGGKAVQLRVTSAQENLTRGTIRDTQGAICRLLGMASTTFKHAAVFGQGRAYRFSRLTDTEKKFVLDEMLGSELYGRASTIASERANAKDQEHERIARESTRTSDQIGEARERLCDLQRRAEKANREATADRLNAEHEIAKLRKQLRRLKLDNVTRLRDEETKLNDACLAAEERYKKAMWVLKQAKDELASLDAKRTKIARSEATTCVSCDQVINATHVAKQLKTIDAQIVTATEAIAAAEKDVKWHSLALQKATREAEDKEKAVLHEEDKAVRRDRLLDKLDDAKDQHKRLSKRNDYKEMIDDERERLHKLKRRLKAEQRAAVKAKRELAQLRFWQHGFGTKGLRSLLLDSVLPYLNAKLEMYSNALTAGNIAIEFRTQRTLKGGSVKEDFHVHVANKHGASKYNMNSIGERAKIDIIVGLALQDMAASRSRVPVNVAFFDEVFDGLDKQGVDRVVQVLAQLKRESAFVITHNDELKAFFNHTIRVVKENGESRLE